MESTAAGSVRARLREWARARGVEVDTDGYCASLGENLFVPLSPQCYRAFAAGDGSELGRNGGRGKMQALHSSSALACNVFDYWNHRSLAPTPELCGLANALGVEHVVTDVAFEQKFPTGLGGNPPNLDVVLRGPAVALTAIESKFLEPYQSRAKSGFRDSYFPRGRRLWEDRGLPQCQRLAEQIHAGAARFERLDAVQLLKHMLGLGASGLRWRLLCIWYRVEGEAGDRHAAELAEFSGRLGAERDRFGAISYQHLFERLCAAVPEETHAGYLRYLRGRYF